MQIKRLLLQAFLIAAIFLVVLIWSVPFIWMFLGSIKEADVIASTDLVLLFKPTLEHYRTIFLKYPFFRYLLNSVEVAVAVCLLTMAAGTLTAYSISRFRFGGAPFSYWVLFTRMLPPPVLIVPLFIIFRTMGLINSLAALVLANSTFLLSFVIWVMRSFFDEVPYALEESAMIDGASRFQALVYVVMPLVTPGMITTLILTFITAWNEYLFAMVLAPATSVKTLPVAAGDFITGYAINWGPVFASGSLIVLPVFVISVFLQRYLVKGLTLGAIK